MIVTQALQAAGIDVDQLLLSQSSLMQAHNNSGQVVAAKVQQKFQPTVLLVAHFNSKLLANLAGINYKYLAIVVSGLHWNLDAARQKWSNDGSKSGKVCL